MLDVLNGVLGIDIETSSAANIKSGSWTYSKHPSTRVWCVVLCYADIETGKRTYFLWEPERDEALADRVCNYVSCGGILIAHNTTFEQSIWTNVLSKRYAWPKFELEQWRDTAALGSALNLPKTLNGLAKALGCAQLKDDVGHKLMLSMAVARESTKNPGTWVYPVSTPRRRKRLAVYCRRDVDAMLDAYFAMPPLSAIEFQLWLEDQRINARGVRLDYRLAQKCAKLVKERKTQLASEAQRISTFEVSNAVSAPGMKRWLEDQGIELPKAKRTRKGGKVVQTTTIDKTAVRNILERADTESTVRAMLENRVEASKAASLAKLNRVDSMVDVDDSRLRHALQYCGANTGRWTSYGLQLHNLPRNKLTAVESELALNCIAEGDLAALALFEPRPLEAISNLLRSLICAPKGRELICADYSAIEARIVAWLAGQDDITKRFEAGEDVYVYTAESIGAPDRFTGKVCTLALGYGMGALKLHSTMFGFGVRYPLKEISRMHRAWRGTNPMIVMFWDEVDLACHQVLEAPIGHTESVARGLVTIYRTAQCMMIRLPSGRVLRYWRPRLEWTTKRIEVLTEDGEIEVREMRTQELRYFQVGKDKDSMTPTATYGGKLVENITQAIARDLLGEALLRLRPRKLYETVMHVHDSIATEVPTGAGDVDEFCEIITRRPSWARGCPVAAEGYRAMRFKG